MAQKTAFVFPGQGSQVVGMLADLADQFGVIKETFEEASQALGYDMWSLVQSGPKEQLDLTEKTQPVMLVAGVSVWRAWCQAGGSQPDLMAGHSLGEYTALVCSGALSFSDGVRLVEKRGEFMRDAVLSGQGKMAAIIGLEDQRVVEACDNAAQGQVVQAVNFNAPGQVVIAGHDEAVDRAIVQCKEAGAKKAMPLAVSVPCHSSLMQPASESLARELSAVEFQSPVIAVVNNVEGRVETDPRVIREKLVLQLYSAVQWVSTIRYMTSAGISTIIECGPGKVLCGLNKRIERGLGVKTLQDPASFEEALSL